MTREQARAALILFYGFDNPSEQQITDFILYGITGVQQ